MGNIIIPKKTISSFLLGAGIIIAVFFLIGLATATFYANENISMGGYTITGLGAPSAGSDVATKSYVDAAGGASYEGLTGSSYTAGQGGVFAANALCDAAYSGSHVCTASEILEIGLTNISEEAWILDDSQFASGETNCWGFKSTCDRIALGNSVITARLDIAVRDDGRPIVAVCETTNDNVTVFSCNDTACNTYSEYQLDSGSTDADGCSIEIRSDGNPVVAYELDDDEVKLYDCDDENCSTGNIRSLASTVARYPDLAINDSDVPFVAYERHSGGGCTAGNCLYVYQCANSDCSSGNERELSDASARDTQYNPDIEIQSNGYPIVAYWDNDATTDQLVINDCGARDCSTGGNEKHTETATQDFAEMEIIQQRPYFMFGNSGTGTQIRSCEDTDCDDVYHANQTVTLHTRSTDAPDIDMAVGQEDRLVVVDGTDDVYMVYDCDSADCDNIREYRVGLIDTPAIAIDETSGRWIIAYDYGPPSLVDQPAIGTTIGESGFGTSICQDTHKFACCS